MTIGPEQVGLVLGTIFFFLSLLLQHSVVVRYDSGHFQSAE